MIINDTKNVSMSALDKIRQSPFNFYLTGSRFFGNSLSNSDWDFFVVDDAKMEVRSWLRENGFVLEDESYIISSGEIDNDFLNDPTISEVWSSRWYKLWKKSAKRLINVEDLVHIQLIKPGIYMEAKLKVQEVLKGMAFFSTLTKSERKIAWRVLLHEAILWKGV